MSLTELIDGLPELARDVKLNLQAVLASSALTPAQRWGVAVASAAASRNPVVLDAIVAEAHIYADAAVVDDGLAAAAVMAMNNVYYRFRHQIGKESYSDKPARLRMNRLVRPSTNRTDFELYALAVSAVHGCEACVRAHEAVVIEGGLSEDQVHDAIRIAATVHSVAVAVAITAPARRRTTDRDASA